jgi:hypothetical protein
MFDLEQSLYDIYIIKKRREYTDGNYLDLSMKLPLYIDLFTSCFLYIDYIDIFFERLLVVN